MEISTEKTKLRTNDTSSIDTEIKVNGQKLETVTSFKYLGSVITDNRKETQTAVVCSCFPVHQVWPKPSSKAQ